MSRARLPKGRPGKRRPRGKRVLIACNADITEPAYFARLRERLGLSPGLIEVNKSETPIPSWRRPERCSKEMPTRLEKRL